MNDVNLRLSIEEFPQEVLIHIFDYCDTKDHTQMALVCKNWHKAANEVIKLQLFRGDKIQKKATPFLQMVSGKSLSDFCPAYFNHLNEIREESKNLTILQIREKIKKIPRTIYRRESIYFSNFFKISPSSDIPADKIIDLSNKSFCCLDMTQESGIYRFCENLIHYRSEEELVNHPEYTDISYFPLELFNLKVNPDGQVIGEKTKGSTCFVLKGVLVEVFLENGTDKSQLPLSFGHLIVLDTDSAKEVVLNASSLLDCYIPRLHGTIN